MMLSLWTQCSWAAQVAPNTGLSLQLHKDIEEFVGTEAGLDGDRTGTAGVPGEGEAREEPLS